MKTIILFFLFLIPSCSLIAQDNPPLTINIPGRVYRVVDGDTVDIETTIRFRVRLRECWAPESRTINLEQKKLGLKSKQNLVKHALGKKVIVVIPFDVVKLQTHTGRIGDVFTFGRVLGEVYVNGKRLSDIQYEAGLSGRTKEEQKRLFPVHEKKQDIEMEIDP